MRVNPVSAEKANEQSGAFEPWAPGDYDFTVNDASDEISQSSGNEQIKLTLHVFNRDGKHRTVFDYLVNTEGGQWKIRHFAEAIGILGKYETGDMDPRDMLNRNGRLTLRIKPASGNYSANNAVKDYLAAAGGIQRAAPVSRPAPARQPVAAGAGRDLDDDIPF